MEDANIPNPDDQVYYDNLLSESRSLLDSANRISPAEPRPVSPPSMLPGGLSWIPDTGVDLLKGAVGLGQSISGIGNILTGNRLGKLTDQVGYDPERTNEYLSTLYSPERQEANRNVQEAKGFVPTVKAYAQNPRSALGIIAESAPGSMGIVAGLGPTLAKYTASLLAAQGLKVGTPAAVQFLSSPAVQAKIYAVGAAASGAMEGFQQAGSLQAQGEAAGKDWSDTVGPALASGIGTGAISALTGRIPGLRDVESKMAMSMLPGGQKFRTGMGEKVRAFGKDVIKEGPIEEMPQSAQEQIFQNLAMGRPWNEGVSEAAAAGFVAGTGQGGGMSIASQTLDHLKGVPNPNLQSSGDSLPGVFKNFGEFPDPTPPAGPLVPVEPDLTYLGRREYDPTQNPNQLPGPTNMLPEKYVTSDGLPWNGDIAGWDGPQGDQRTWFPDSNANPTDERQEKAGWTPPVDNPTPDYPASGSVQNIDMTKLDWPMSQGDVNVAPQVHSLHTQPTPAETSVPTNVITGRKVSTPSSAERINEASKVADLIDKTTSPNLSTQVHPTTGEIVFSDPEQSMAGIFKPAGVLFNQKYGGWVASPAQATSLIQPLQDSFPMVPAAPSPTGDIGVQGVPGTMGVPATPAESGSLASPAFGTPVPMAGRVPAAPAAPGAPASTPLEMAIEEARATLGEGQAVPRPPKKATKKSTKATMPAPATDQTQGRLWDKYGLSARESYNEPLEFNTEQEANDYITSRRLQRDNSLFEKHVDVNSGRTVLRDTNYFWDMEGVGGPQVGSLLARKQGPVEGLVKTGKEPPTALHRSPINNLTRLLGPGQMGKGKKVIQYNPESRTDVGARMDSGFGIPVAVKGFSAKQVEKAYTYTPEIRGVAEPEKIVMSKNEAFRTTGRTAYRYDISNHYDAENDALGLWKQADLIFSANPHAHRGVVFSNLVKDQGYSGYVFNFDKEGKERWAATFSPVKIQENLGKVSAKQQSPETQPESSPQGKLLTEEGQPETVSEWAGELQPVKHSTVVSFVDKLNKSLPPGLTVKAIQSADELPPAIQPTISRLGENSQVFGYMDPDGTCYLITSSFASVDHIYETLAHELIGHYGIEQMMGAEQFNSMMISAYHDMMSHPETKAEMTKVWKLYNTLGSQPNFDLYTDAGKIRLMSEMVAHIAETSQNPSWFESIISSIRDFLRKLGLDVEWTNQDIRHILRKSSDYIFSQAPSVDTTSGGLQIKVFHGTDRKFRKFSTTRFGEGEGSASFGWGLYFTDLRSVAEFYAEKAGKHQKGGKGYTIEATLHQGKDPSEYRYLEWEAPVDAKTLKVIRKDLNPEQLRNFDETLDTLKKEYNGSGGAVYTALRTALYEHKAKSADPYQQSYLETASKTASLYLLKRGIDGMRYPTGTIMGGNKINKEQGHNYVVFDAEAVKINRTKQTFGRFLVRRNDKFDTGSVMADMDTTNLSPAAPPSDINYLANGKALPLLQDLPDDPAVHKLWAAVAGVMRSLTTPNHPYLGLNRSMVEDMLGSEPNLKGSSRAAWTDLQNFYVSALGTIVDPKRVTITTELTDMPERVGRLSLKKADGPLKDDEFYQRSLRPYMVQAKREINLKGDESIQEFIRNKRPTVMSDANRAKKKLADILEEYAKKPKRDAVPTLEQVKNWKAEVDNMREFVKRFKSAVDEYKNIWITALDIQQGKTATKPEGRPEFLVNGEPVPAMSRRPSVMIQNIYTAIEALLKKVSGYDGEFTPGQRNFAQMRIEKLFKSTTTKGISFRSDKAEDTIHDLNTLREWYHNNFGWHYQKDNKKPLKKVTVSLKPPDATSTTTPITDGPGGGKFLIRQGHPPSGPTVKSYKLFRTLKTRPGEIFPLFIGNKDSIPVGEWLTAEPLPTKGYKDRSGWHSGDRPSTSHLTEKDRVWAEIEIPMTTEDPPSDGAPPSPNGQYRYKVNKNQGGEWTISGSMKVLRILDQNDIKKILSGKKTVGKLSVKSSDESSKSSEAERAAELHGLTFKGTMDYGDMGILHYFNDPQAKNTTIAVKSLDELEQKVADTREKFASYDAGKLMAKLNRTKLEYKSYLRDKETRRLQKNIEGRKEAEKTGKPFVPIPPDRGREHWLSIRDDVGGTFTQPNDRWYGQPLTLADRLKESLSSVKSWWKENITPQLQHFKDINYSDPSQLPIVEHLRQAEEVPRYARELVGRQNQRLLNILKNPKDRDIYEHIIILRDLLREVTGGKVASLGPQNVSDTLTAQGYADLSQLRAHLTHFETLANPAVNEALNLRKDFWTRWRRQAVSADILPDSVLDNEAYFHHQVSAWKELNDRYSGTAPGMHKTKKSFQKGRTGYSGEYNLDYFESETGVLVDLITQVQSAKALEGIRTNHNLNVLPVLVAEAARLNAANPSVKSTWRTVLRSGTMLDPFGNPITEQTHDFYKPVRGNFFHRVLTLTERSIRKVAEELQTVVGGMSTIDELMDIARMHAGSALATGLRQPLTENYMVLNRSVINAMENFQKQSEPSFLGKFTSDMQTAWKRWVLFNPYRVVRYLLNNTTGDADIAFAFRPGVFKHVPSAYKELFSWAYKNSAGLSQSTRNTLETLNRKGLLGSGITVQEIPELSDETLTKLINDPRPQLIKRWFKGVHKFNNFRENIMRYAAWKYMKAESDAGRFDDLHYAASKKAEVDSISSMDDKIVKMSRELVGDYGNISYVGTKLRKYVIPFWSWAEINAPRYYHMMRNELAAGNRAGGLKIAGVLGAKAAVRAMAFAALVMAWNFAFFRDEEEEMRRLGRDQLHLILGRHSDGSVISLRVQGSFSDTLGWVGAENLLEELRSIKKGRVTPAEEAKSVLMAPVKRLIGGAVPLYKMAGEAAIGKTMFPEPFAARPIRDKFQHIMKGVGADWITDRWVQHKPAPPLFSLKAIAKPFLYVTDTHEAAYFHSIKLANDWLKDQGKPRTTSEPTPRSNALYYWRQASKLKDKEGVEYYKALYIKLGGNTKGMEQSVKHTDPLIIIPLKDRAQFLKSLGEDNKKTWTMGVKWWSETFRGNRLTEPKPSQTSDTEG